MQQFWLKLFEFQNAQNIRGELGKCKQPFHGDHPPPPKIKIIPSDFYILKIYCFYANVCVSESSIKSETVKIIPSSILLVSFCWFQGFFK